MIRGASRARGDDVGRQAIVEVAAVAKLDLLDRGVADRLERPALDLALGKDRVDDLADVVGGHDVADRHLAAVEVDIDSGDAGRPAERRVGVAAVGLVVEVDVRIGLELLVDPSRCRASPRPQLERRRTEPGRCAPRRPRGAAERP